MDLATIIGIIVAFVVVLGAIFAGGEFMTFVNVPSILIVVGGATATTVLRFPLTGVLGAFALGGKIVFSQKKFNAREMIDEMARLADIIRKNGPLGLEGVPIEDEFLSKGIQYIADGYNAEFIRETMERERDLNLDRLEEGARVYKAYGDAAPAFGMIGTLVGLVQMLSTMDDPSTIGPSMAVALLTTLYGAMISNMVCLPISDKLNSKFKTEELSQNLAIDGILQIRANKSPDVIKDVLVSYLPQNLRDEETEAA
jgi:chemotaxis protein MotA